VTLILRTVGKHPNGLSYVYFKSDLKGDKEMDAGTLIWVSALTIGVVLLGWFGSILDNQNHKKPYDRPHSF